MLKICLCLNTIPFIYFHSLNSNSSKWSNTLKQFVGCCRRIVWVCLTILWSWHLKGLSILSLRIQIKLKIQMKNSEGLTNILDSTFDDSHCLNSVRSSRSQLYFKIGVFKNYANFTGKQLCWCVFLIDNSFSFII